MKNRFVIFLFLVLTFAFLTISYADEKRTLDTATTDKDQLLLSPELKQVLLQEMQFIQKGMITLIPAISSGKWHEVEEIGEKIDNSYIMKQQLSEMQVEELHSSLPALFKELDHSFHHAAGMLAHAAKERNADIVIFYFYKLTETCVKCHSKYAKGKFPNFKNDDTKHERH